MDQKIFDIFGEKNRMRILEKFILHALQNESEKKANFSKIYGIVDIIIIGK